MEKLIGDKTTVHLLDVLKLYLFSKYLINKAGEKLVEYPLVGKEVFVGAVVVFSPLCHTFSVYPAVDTTGK
jgi:isopentenyldiphosphate isomerase